MSFFFKLLLRTFDVVRQLRPCHARQVNKTRQRGNGKVLNSACAKMVDVCVRNVNKHTKARTKMEPGKLWTRAAQ